MKLVITGGHLSPALAVLDALPKNVEVLVVGRKYPLEGDKTVSLEYQTMMERKIPFYSVTTGRLQRKITKRTIFSLLKLPFGFFQAFSVLRKFKPDAVLSFGGYVSFPITLVAYFLKIPIVVHEQTLEGGLANRITSCFAKKVCLSWESSRNFFPKSKTILTGNPIRKFQISRLAAKRANIKYQISNEHTPLIYITGGSTGSHAINILVEGCIKKLLEKYRVVHQVGDAREFGDFDRLENLRYSLDPVLRNRYFLTKFIKPAEIGSILKAACLVVSRSGMNTLTELIFFRKPALLIPLPYSQGNEQLKNALFFKELGLGKIAFQDELTSDRLYKHVSCMVENIKAYEKSEKKVKQLISVDAAKKIVETVVSEAKK